MGNIIFVVVELCSFLLPRGCVGCHACWVGRQAHVSLCVSCSCTAMGRQAHLLMALSCVVDLSTIAIPHLPVECSPLFHGGMLPQGASGPFRSRERAPFFFPLCAEERSSLACHVCGGTSAPLVASHSGSGNPLDSPWHVCVL